MGSSGEIRRRRHATPRNRGFGPTEALAHVRLTLWLAIGGLVVVYFFFLFVATIPLSDVGWLTAAAGALSAMIGLRQARLSSELADPAGDPALRRRCNRQRERRGF